MLVTWCHDYAGGDVAWYHKNLSNALFYATGQLGSIRVAANSLPGGTEVARAAFEWCALLMLGTFSTVQIQDLRDQEGDRIRGRRTMPLVLGDGPTRWLTATLVIFWSVLFPLYWSEDGRRLTAAYALPIVIGGLVAWRTVACRGVKSDRSTFHWYTLLWLPVCKSISENPRLSNIPAPKCLKRFLTDFELTGSIRF